MENIIPLGDMKGKIAELRVEMGKLSNLFRPRRNKEGIITRESFSESIKGIEDLGKAIDAIVQNAQS